jgi:AcrR family transcriptional regulator
VGRHRQHDDSTAEALLDAAETIIASRGVEALLLRDVAGHADTTTRAIYTLFGSKDGLVGALGVRGFNLLQASIEAFPVTDRPAEDLVELALIFRRFALEHRAIFSIVFQRADPALWPLFQDAAADALAVLDQRFEPLADADLLGGRSIPEASTQYRALCEGVAWTELRGNPLPPEPERFWRNAFHALITGFASPTPRRHVARRATRGRMPSDPAGSERRAVPLIPDGAVKAAPGG